MNMHDNTRALADLAALTSALDTLIEAAEVMLDADPSSIREQAEAAAGLYKAVDAAKAIPGPLSRKAATPPRTPETPADPASEAASASELLNRPVSDDCLRLPPETVRHIRNTFPPTKPS